MKLHKASENLDAFVHNNESSVKQIKPEELVFL